MNDIADLVVVAFRDAQAKGFEPGPFSETCMLIASEISEAFEEHRDGRDYTEIYYKTDSLGYQKPEGIPIELADAVIRIAHFCGYRGIDLTSAIQEKLDYNRKRPHRHGKRF